MIDDEAKVHEAGCDHGITRDHALTPAGDKLS
jgi:hypothetical protein